MQTAFAKAPGFGQSCTESRALCESSQFFSLKEKENPLLLSSGESRLQPVPHARFELGSHHWAMG